MFVAIPKHHTQRKRLLFIALCIDRYSPGWEDSHIFLPISTCTSSITMSNSAELPDRKYIVPLCVLNAFFALTAVVLNSVTIHAIRKMSSASLPKNLRVLLLNLVFSDLSVGLVAQPFYIIHLTFPGDYSHKMNAVSVITEISLCFNLRSVGS